MILLPIVEREMRTAARRPQVHLLRVGAAAAAIVLLLVIFVSNRHPASSGLFAKLIFMGLSVPRLGFSPLGAFLYATDSYYGPGRGALRYWVSVNLLALAALALVAAASRRLPRLTRPVSLPAPQCSGRFRSGPDGAAPVSGQDLSP